jgi:hypothetical protein
MNVKILDLDWYQAWVVSSDFGQPRSYLVYMELYNVVQRNAFHEKHLKDPAATALDRRNLAVTSLDDKIDAVSRLDLGGKLKSTAADLEIKSGGKTKTNTAIDWTKIDVKLAAFKFAKALLEAMLAGEFGDYAREANVRAASDITVDLGTPCVVTVGKISGISSTIKIGGSRISTLNGKNQVSFRIDHCGGT